MSAPRSHDVPPAGMVKADFVTGILLMALGLATVVASLEMPRFEELNVDPYTVPGLVPGALGAVILVLGSVLCVRAARAGGWRLFQTAAGRAWHADPGTRNLAVAVVLCLGYAAGLVGRVPFWLATFVFVGLFVALFEWRLAASGAERAPRLVFAFAFAAVISAAVTLVFQEVFLVRLP